jgi:integrase
MARTLNKLTDTGAKAEKSPGRHSDGGGLYLNVSTAGTKSWLFMWTPKGSKSRHELGLGGYPAVSLAKARAVAAGYRVDIAEGRNPKEERDRTPEPLFEDATELFISSQESEWRNDKHVWQWRQTMKAHCAPINKKRPSQVTTEDVLACLKPIWTKLPETAARVRGRIERVLNFCKVKGWRSADSVNPAAWAGHLENLLPKRGKLSRGHQAALPYGRVPEFVGRLQGVETLGARALELTILTVSRTGETIGMQWGELDMAKALWTVPAERMKAGKPHVVPLVPRAVEILKALKETSTSAIYVFPSQAKRKPGTPERPLSNMAMLKLLKSMLAEGEEATVHGFRSSFRDWAGDMTNFPREIAEAALAHSVGNEVEQAYRRSTALVKRTKLMEAWAAYVARPQTGNVVPLQKSPAA